MAGRIQQFFAVTRTSVYHVKLKGGEANATKIAVRGESLIRVGAIIYGPMIAIHSRLTGYIPEGGGYTSYARRIEDVNSRYWRESTSRIVALFRTKKEAITCLAIEDTKSCDPRWEKQTLAVIEAIGDDHPNFYVSHDKDMALPLVLKMQTA